MTGLTAMVLSCAPLLLLDNRASAAKKSCLIRTRYGVYNGFVGKRGVQTWLGIPYAKPPVGKLRFQAPQKLEPSDAEFDAKKFGFAPRQDEDPMEPASLTPKSEDCLTLNIWTRPHEGLKPVMVFIPGGGFVNGGTSDPLYNGTNLAASQDVVVVTLNYRLNIYGFMNFGAIDSNFETSGYNGIMDQLAAIEWVKENIEQFGGDPENITLFGESAGASSVSLLMVAPAAKGLFQKAIAESGSCAYYHTPEMAAEIAEGFMRSGGFRNMNEVMLKSADELETIYEKFYIERGFTSESDYFPMCDGKFLPLHPYHALKNGAAKGIKFLSGNTGEEYRYWLLYLKDFVVNTKKYHKQATSTVYEGEFTNSEEIYEAWRKNHMDIPEDSRYFEFANQLDWRVGQELAAEYQSAFDDVYLYLFNEKSPISHLGSCHMMELPYVFGNPVEFVAPKLVGKLVKQMQASWGAFAATSNPNNALIPEWKPYTVDDRQTMEINSKAWTCRKDLNTQNLNELRSFYEDNLLD